MTVGGWRQFLPVLWTLIGAGAFGQVADLHLTLGGDPTTQITVSWRAPETPGFELVDKCAGELVELTAIASDGGTWHHARLTGLAPDRQYRYRITSDAGATTGNFTTAPARSTGFSFAVLGDIQGSAPSKKWQRVAGWVADRAPAFFVSVGDFVEHGLEPAEWRAFFGDAGRLCRQTPLMPVIGNHDCYCDRAPELKPQLFLDQFAVPDNHVAGYRGYWYAFDYGDAHLVVLCNFPAGGPVPAREADKLQTNWLRQDLATTRKKWKFVFFHVPVYSSGPHGEDTVALAKTWGQLFDEAHVDVVFNGHTHAFEITRPIRAGQATNPANGTVYYNCAGVNYSAVAHENWFTMKAQEREQMQLPALVEIKGDTARITTPDLDAGVVYDEFRLTKHAD